MVFPLLGPQRARAVTCSALEAGLGAGAGGGFGAAGTGNCHWLKPQASPACGMDAKSLRETLPSLLRDDLILQFLLRLDDEQLSAALSPFSPLLITAGPGSGKTRTIAARALVLHAGGVFPSQILTLSFAKAAREEIQQRLCSVVGAARGAQFQCRTFHSLALRLYRTFPAGAAAILQRGVMRGLPMALPEGGGGLGASLELSFKEEDFRTIFEVAMLMEMEEREKEEKRAQQARSHGAAAAGGAAAAAAEPAKKFITLNPVGLRKLELFLQGEPLKHLDPGVDYSVMLVQGGRSVQIEDWGRLKTFSRDREKYQKMWVFARTWGLGLADVGTCVPEELKGSMKGRDTPLPPPLTQEDKGVLRNLFSIASRYTVLCALLGLLDSYDLLRVAAGLLEKPAVQSWVKRNYQAVLVDEFQDLSALQMKLLVGLSAHLQPCPKDFAPAPAAAAARGWAAGGGGGGGGGGPIPCITAVGDGRQSIMSFQGAFPAVFLHWKHHFPTSREVALTSNYRSTERIVAAENAIIAGSQARQRFPMCRALRAGGEGVRIVACGDLECEAQHLINTICAHVHSGGRYADYAILARTKRSVLQLAVVFRLLGIPYSRQGSSSYPLRPLKRFAALLRIVAADPMAPWDGDQERAFLDFFKGAFPGLEKKCANMLWKMQRGSGGGGGGGGGAGAAAGAAAAAAAAAPAPSANMEGRLKRLCEQSQVALEAVTEATAALKAAEKAEERVMERAAKKQKKGGGGGAGGPGSCRRPDSSQCGRGGGLRGI